MGFYKQLSQTIYYILRSLKMIFTKKNMFFILFIAVFIACCLFSNKVFADEQEVSLSTLDGYGIYFGTGAVYENSNRSFVYFQSQSNMIYHITSNFPPETRTVIWVSNSVPTAGSTLIKLTDLYGGQTYDYYGDLYFVLENVQNTDLEKSISVTSELASSYDNTIDNLTQAISLDNLWSQFGVGLIALAVLFAVGFFVVRKVLKKDSQYKG